MSKFDKEKFWKYFAYGYFLFNTLCILILFELIFFNFPYISSFLLLYTITISVNYYFFIKPQKAAKNPLK